MYKISRAKYADMYGPTTGDRIRLADTALVIQVERDAARYGEEARRTAEGGQEEARELNRSVIEAECAAYILDKAEALGLEACEAAVQADWDAEGFWVPRRCSVRRTGGYDAALSAAIEAELGIPAERQEWGELG